MRSYLLRPMGNAQKTRTIEQRLLPEWRRVAQVLVGQHVAHFYRYGELHQGNSLYKPIPTFLSERYKDAINRQVLGMLRSKISNLKNRFVKVVLKSSLPTEAQKKLCFIGKYQMWFRREPYISNGITIGLGDLKLARKVFKGLLGGWPQCGNINMQLQSKVAMLEPCKGKGFGWMLRLATPTKGKPMWLPLKGNPYCERFTGKLSTSVELQFKGGRLVAAKISKEVTPEPLGLTQKTLSFDLGLKRFITVDTGEAHGMRMMRKLKWFDAKLMRLQGELKKAHGGRVRLNGFPQYQRLQWRIRMYIRNEVNRILNLIIHRHRPSTINVEDLDFRGAGLSRKLNRMLSRFGLGPLAAKLESLEQLGVKVNQVDAAYTSQCCSRCGWTHKDNRKTQSEFCCTRCGYSGNADHNASIVVGQFSERFGQERFYGTKGRERKLKVLLGEYQQGLWRGIKSDAQAALGLRPQACPI